MWCRVMKAMIHNNSVELSFTQFMSVFQLMNDTLIKIYGGLDKVPEDDYERIRCVIHNPVNGSLSVDFGIRSPECLW